MVEKKGVGVKRKGAVEINATAEAVYVNDCMFFLRRRLCGGLDCPVDCLPLLPDAELNRRQLEDLLVQTILRAYNNSALLVGPRGCGKSLVLQRVLVDIQAQYPDRFITVLLNGFLHADDNAALKQIAKQLCVGNDLTYAKGASFEENLQFLMAVLRDYALSHKAVVFVLDEFDLFAQRPKQVLLYNLLDAMQSNSSQLAVIGISSRMDADQLLEKRVRSRFSHRKLLFLPPVAEDVISLHCNLVCRYMLDHHIHKLLLQDSLTLPEEDSFPHLEYARHFNQKTKDLLQQPSTKELLSEFIGVTLTPRSILDLAFRAICNMNRELGILSEANLKAASKSLRRRPKLDSIKDLSVLELYMLVAMNRLEGKEREVYNFNTAFKEYEHLSKVHSTSDFYSREVSLRAFEHLVERELIVFTDRNSSIEFRTVKLLISSHQLKEGLVNNPVCPTVLHQWFAHESFK